jgi:hypothetical protein
VSTRSAIRARTPVEQVDRVVRAGAVSRSVAAWVLVAIWSLGVCVAHFGGLAYGTYYAIWWWDVLTHAAGGLGVAAILYLLRPDLYRSPVALFVVLPLTVLVIGAAFEVYERVFRTFWHTWSVSRYVEDTLLDLVVDTAGALVVSLLVVLVRTGRRLTAIVRSR